MTRARVPVFRPLTGVFEPSAIQQLADGRFLVVEDEKEHPFSLITITVDGEVEANPLTPGWLQIFDDFWRLDDLEGVAVDRAGNIYAITSHSRDGDGEQKKARDRLVRFRIEGDRVVATHVVGGLKAALAARHPELAAAARIRDVKEDGGLNIEAIEISPDARRLLIGLRSPLHGGRAIIASIDNPAACFETGAPPQVGAELITLDLDGNGIRGLCHVPVLNGYLLISGPVARQQVQFQLWFWNGDAAAPARRVSVDDLPGYEHAEGVSPASIGGEQLIVIVSDDGDRQRGRYAHFLLLAPEQLQIAG